MNDRNEKPNKTGQQTTWLPLAVLGGALVVWTGLLALGAYLELGADKPQHDLRKALIILGTMAAFLAFWAIALWRRAKRGDDGKDRP